MDGGRIPAVIITALKSASSENRRDESVFEAFLQSVAESD